jgi:hypothetical protein
MHIDHIPCEAYMAGPTISLLCHLSDRLLEGSARRLYKTRANSAGC